MTIRELPLYDSLSVQAFMPVTYPEEVIYSTGFESGVGGWTPGTVTTSVARTGAQALSVPSQETTGWFNSTEIDTGLPALEVGKSYTFSGWARPATQTSVSARMWIDDGSFHNGPNVALTLGTWTKVSHTFVASSSTIAYIQAYSTKPGFTDPGVVYWDDMSLVRDEYTVTEWNPIHADATGIKIRRGGSRDGLGVRTDVGLCTFILSDAQDPLNGGVLEPGMEVKVTTDQPSADTPIFMGRIAFLNSRYLLNKADGTTRAVTQVTVADAVKVHMATQRYGVDLGMDTDETFEERIGRLEVSAQAPVDAPAVGAPIEVYAL